IRRPPRSTLFPYTTLSRSERDKSPQEFAGTTSGEQISKRIQGGNVATGHLSSVWGNALTTRITAAFNTKTIPVVAYRTDVPSRNIYAGTVLSGGRLTGTGLLAVVDNGPNWQDLPYRKYTVSGDATYARRGPLGDHELQAGMFWQQVHEETIFHYPANGFSVEDVVLN